MFIYIKRFVFLWFVVFLLCGAVLSAPSYNVFKDENFGYQINCPADWVCEKPSNYSIVFSGKEGTGAYYSTVSIQNVASVKMGGKHRDVESVVNSQKSQLTAGAVNTKIYDEKNFIYALKNKKLKGIEFKTEYIRQKENFKQWIIVIPHPKGQLFYVWSYTSPIDQYDEYFKIAKAMLGSWKIFE